MKIAIHERINSYSDQWIKYCKLYKISYKVVDCYHSDIVEHLSDCDGLMWHWDLNDYKSTLFAKQLTVSLEKNGLKVFPSTATAWHYDDKVGQKYLFESIGVPSVPTYIFYTKSEAFEWISTAKFPIVSKLRCGASALNVKLVKNSKEAEKLTRIAFMRGFSPINRIENIKSRISKFKKKKNLSSFIKVLKGFGRLCIRTNNERYSPRQKGYIYFQDFIPNNSFDTRIEVIGNRCTAVRRYNRKNDFRASGSGDWAFDRKLIDLKMIKLAFEISEKLNLQSVAFDFIVDNNEYRLIEMSYCWPTEGSLYTGYWDNDLNWHDGDIISEYFMISEFISEIVKSK